MPRRVVTGVDRAGWSVFVSDGEVAAKRLASAPTGGFFDVWGGDTRPVAPTDGSPPPYTAFFPPVAGWRFMVVVMPPEAAPAVEVDPADLVAQMERDFPGMAAHMEPEHPGMHTTATVDVGVVLDGEIWLELDDGEIRHLRTGDMVVQNGTRHAWRNRSDRPTTMAFVLIGADPPG